MFTEAEVGYLEDQPLGRLATVGPDGSPHNVPVGFRYNAGLGTIDIGGRALGVSRKFRDVQREPRVAFVVDDLVSTEPWRPRGIEIRGTAETLAEGGHAMSPYFGAELIRIHPTRVISWGVDGATYGPLHARDV